MGKLDLFAILKDINLEKTFSLHKDPDFQKAYDDFMINRYFSMSPETVLEANFMNIHNKLPKHVKYLFLSDVIEKKNRFLKYVKSDKESQDKETIKYIQDLYRVNKNTAEGIAKTISQEEKDLLKLVFTQKTIKKR